MLRALEGEEVVHASCRLPIELMDQIEAQASMLPALTWIRDAVTRQLCAAGRISASDGTIVINRAEAQPSVEAQP